MPTTGSGTVKLRVIDSADRQGRRRHRPPVIVNVADAYGDDRQIEVQRHGRDHGSPPATPAVGTTSR